MNRLKSLLVAMIVLALISCKDDEPKAKQIVHEGESWTITSFEYSLIEQSLSGMNVDSGTKSNAGAFYFNGGTGSFDIDLGDTQMEDYFNYEETSGDINITSIDQQVGGGSVSQSVIAIDGETTSTTMTLDVSITKQSTLGQTVLTGTMDLTKD